MREQNGRQGRGIVYAQSKSNMSELNSFIEEMELFDVLLIGRSFTWISPANTTVSCIDRVLVARNSCRIGHNLFNTFLIVQCLIIALWY